MVIGGIIAAIIAVVACGFLIVILYRIFFANAEEECDDKAETSSEENDYGK